MDEQQINLDRFNLFFPEKRPFFLENAGLFPVGNPGQTELLFSRRTGISDDGAPISIFGGGRLSGKTVADHQVQPALRPPEMRNDQIRIGQAFRAA